MIEIGKLPAGSIFYSRGWPLGCRCVGVVIGKDRDGAIVRITSACPQHPRMHGRETVIFNEFQVEPDPLAVALESAFAA